ncbi:hypothetical protein ACOMHN_024151 [Nucella lapillus]
MCPPHLQTNQLKRKPPALKDGNIHNLPVPTLWPGDRHQDNVPTSPGDIHSDRLAPSASEWMDGGTGLLTGSLCIKIWRLTAHPDPAQKSLLIKRFLRQSLNQMKLLAGDLQPEYSLVEKTHQKTVYTKTGRTVQAPQSPDL